MTIATVEYKGHEISAYSHQIFPPHRDPYAKGPKAFSSFVRIDTIPSREIKTRRYAASSSELDPTTIDDAIDVAIQYGKDIIDGKIKGTEI
jgi:hypothetical protein